MKDKGQRISNVYKASVPKSETDYQGTFISIIY